MAYNIDELINTQAEIEKGKWVTARPIVPPFKLRIWDAFKVLFGYCDAVKFYKQ